MEKYLDNKCSPQEVKLLLSYFHQDSFDEKQIMELILIQLQQDPGKGEPEDTNLQTTIERAYHNIRFEIDNNEPVKNKPIRQLWTKILGAAVILITVGAFCLYFLHNARQQNKIGNIADVKPGHRGATLTLANGRKIILHEAPEGDLAVEGNIEVSKNAVGEIIYTPKKLRDPENSGSELNTLSTANGETYKIVLSDGTKVWLNAASTLQYSAHVGERNKRIVRLLAGEAYFEVSKDKLRPFIVETASQQVEVLGTHFNINSYPDEPAMVTTLEEGSVRVKRIGALHRDPGFVTLVPGQQAVSRKGGIEVGTADLYTALSWKNGQILFKQATVQSILRQVSRWYDVKIVYQGRIPSRKFTGGINRTDNLNDLLKILELNDLHFELVNNTLIVNP